MSTHYRTLRSAIDKEIAAEEAEIAAKQKRWNAVAEMGKAIKALRLHKKMSLRKCAGDAKISAPFLSDIEKGRRSMSDDTCEMILGVLMPDIRMGP